MDYETWNEEKDMVEKREWGIPTDPALILAGEFIICGFKDVTFERILGYVYFDLYVPKIYLKLLIEVDGESKHDDEI